MKHFYCIILFGLLFTNTLKAQCFIPGSEDCPTATLLMSPEELNGNWCSTYSSKASGAIPLCPHGGGPHNTLWWSFVSGGGPVTITIDLNNLTVNGTGIQFGIWTNCEFNQSVHCEPNCVGPVHRVINLVTEPCQTYYLFTDGCSGDEGDVIFSVEGGNGTCETGEISEINAEPSKKINVCANVSNEFFASEIKRPNLHYEWTLNKQKLQSKTRKINHKFVTPGTYTLCVEAVLEASNGQSYARSNQQCSQVIVNPSGDVRDNNIFLCHEQVDPNPYKWYDQDITQSGLYRSKQISPEGCEIVKVASIQVSDKPDAIAQFYIGNHDKNYYKNTEGKLIKECNNYYEYHSRGKQQCDDYYNVYQFIPSFSTKLERTCKNNKLFYKVIVENNSCSPNKDYSIKYNYILKDLINTSAPTIKSDDLLEIKIKSDYELFLECEIVYGTAYKLLTFDMGKELMDESMYLPNAGKDVSTSRLFTNLNATNGPSGTWKKISGPGNLSFENVNNPQSKVTASVKGTYLAEWSIQIADCKYADEIKLNFGQLETERPKTKPKIIKVDGGQQIRVVPSGSTFQLDESIKLLPPYNCQWISVDGRIIGRFTVQQLKSEIQAPQTSGMYILLIDSNGNSEKIKYQVTK